VTPKIPTPANGFDDGTEHSVRREKIGKFVVETFPEGYILLNRELATGYHPVLEASLATSPVDETDEKLLKCATYVGIVLDGTYTIQDRSQLCATIAGRLENLRDLTKGSGPVIIS